MTKNSAMKQISEQEGTALAAAIIRQLDGLSIGQARWVCELAKSFLDSTHRVEGVRAADEVLRCASDGSDLPPR